MTQDGLMTETRGKVHQTPTRIHFACDPTPEERQAAMLALAFNGAGTLDADDLSETASWDASNRAGIVGRDQVLAALGQVRAPVSLSVTQIVVQGKAATVSGRLTRDGEGLFMFCQILRFASASRTQIAQIVSVEQKE
ncbi:hypothetical protein [Celeribacter sp.]|uniref:hypothetical protein n=1 Tax=Celeribacter sp. TaxID=1890673 RepID=UPI003A9549E6